MVPTVLGNLPVNECWAPRRQPAVATIYYVSWIVVGGFVLFSFFVGAIVGGMNEALDEFKAQEKKESDDKAEKLANASNPK